MLPPLTGTNSLVLFCLPVLCFCFKKWHFCLFKIAIQTVSLRCVCVCVCVCVCLLNWYTPSIFLLSALIPFLWRFGLDKFKNSIFILV
jgi:hypothetical protein